VTAAVTDYTPAIYKRGDEVEIMHGTKRVRAKIVRVKKAEQAHDYVYVAELVLKPQKWASWTPAKRFASRRRLIVRPHAIFPLPEES
jgi:hypothetical protein